MATAPQIAFAAGTATVLIVQPQRAVANPSIGT